MSFLSKLQKKRTQYNYASQARTQAQSLSLLSSGIYTEEERFIYELLQNAIDAFIDVDEEHLKIKIQVQDDFLLFRHNGAAFTEEDIEGLCDVGNGSKANDLKKVGYKGIGFKSVFIKSSQVYVESGPYCFKFDKFDSVNYMPQNLSDGPLKPKDIPWQIIPIETEPPFAVGDEGYNVTTYIQMGSTKSILSKVDKLLKGLNFLLFLNAKDVSITLYDHDKLIRTVGRSYSNGKVSLSIDKKVSSQWLIKRTEIEVTDAVKSYRSENLSSVPQKLQEADSIDVSFAISIDKKGNMQKVKDSVVYTYLPTSYGNLGVPFLINSNFITDAGRQQLQQDSVWNRFIFEQVPFLYLEWIGELSQTYPSYYKVLPRLSPKLNDVLTDIFQDSLEDAIESVAFLPSLISEDVLKVSEAWIDNIGISDVIRQDYLVAHINSERNNDYTLKGQVANKGVKILKAYNVGVFDKDNLPSLFKNTKVFENLSVKRDIKLIDFFYTMCHKEEDDQDDLLNILSRTDFILSDSDQNVAPSDLFFPSDYKSENELAESVVLMSQKVYDHFRKDNDYIKWFVSLGVRELNEDSYVVELCNNPDVVTNDNAILYGRFLFKQYKKSSSFIEEVGDAAVNHFPFLTKGGKLERSANLYLGSHFKPFTDLEADVKDDIYVSEDYIESGDSVSEWKNFFTQMGVSEDITGCVQKPERSVFKNSSSRFDREFFLMLINEVEKHYHQAWSGNYKYFTRSIQYKSYSFLEKIDQYEYAKVVFRGLLNQNSPLSIDSCVEQVNCYSGCSAFSRVLSQKFLIEKNCEVNYFQWLVDNCRVIPTSLKTCEYGKNVLSNTVDDIELISNKYLPVIDLDFPISPEWTEFLHLKDRLDLDDFLTVLDGVAQDDDVDKSDLVSKIYEAIIERGWQTSPLIKKWGKTHKIRSTKGAYLFPRELTYITIDGFKADNRAYVSRNLSESKRTKLLTLFKNLGVRVIDKVVPVFSNEVKRSELKDLLLNKVQYIALIYSSLQKGNGFNRCKDKMTQLIEQSDFYHCDNIMLSYGDEEDTIDRNTFAEGNKFYYTGELRVTKIEPLIKPLCNYLGIGVGAHSEIFTVMIENNHDALVEFLENKDYDVSELVAPVEPEVASCLDIIGYDEGLSLQQMYQAQLEAQMALMKIRSDWSFPKGYGKCDDDGKPFCFSTVDLHDERGDKLSIVLKSYKKRSERFKINPEEWQAVVQDNAKLLVYTRIDDQLDIVEIPQNDLIMDQSNISITFNSENLNKEEYFDRVSIFANTLHFFKGLHFNFERFHIAENANRVKHIYAKQMGIQAPTTDDDL